MANAKTELIEHMESRRILWAQIKAEAEYVDDRMTYAHFALPSGYTVNDGLRFIASLDFEYDDGYGCQELEGVVVYTDGTWSERGEYDGSEWWEHKTMPSYKERK